MLRVSLVNFIHLCTDRNRIVASALPRLKEMTARARKDEDNVSNYGRRVLEVGMMTKALAYLCKNPDRSCTLSLLKMFMPMLLAQSNASKYALEIIRFLVYQYTSPIRDAVETFYRLFVNTKGSSGSHIPVDLCMEHIVKRQKQYISHMYAGKSEKNVDRHTSAMCGINAVADNFDATTDVLVRATVHKAVDSTNDEVILMNELRTLRPFQYVQKRQHKGVGRISPTGLAGLEYDKFHNWLQCKHRIYCAEIGK